MQKLLLCCRKFLWLQSSSGYDWLSNEIERLIEWNAKRCEFLCAIRHEAEHLRMLVGELLLCLMMLCDRGVDVLCALEQFRRLVSESRRAERLRECADVIQTVCAEIALLAWTGFSGWQLIAFHHPSECFATSLLTLRVLETQLRDLIHRALLLRSLNLTWEISDDLANVLCGSAPCLTTLQCGSRLSLSNRLRGLCLGLCRRQHQ